MQPSVGPNKGIGKMRLVRLRLLPLAIRLISAVKVRL